MEKQRLSAIEEQTLILWLQIFVSSPTLVFCSFHLKFNTSSIIFISPWFSTFGYLSGLFQVGVLV